MRCSTFALLALVLASLLPPLQAAPPSHSSVLTTQLVGRPVIVDQKVIWIESAGSGSRVLRYDLAQGSRTLVVERDHPIVALAAVADRLAWLERWNDQTMIFTHASGERQPVSLGLASGNAVAIALDQTTVYVVDQRGLVAYGLATKQEHILSTRGQQPVATSDALLWSEMSDALPGQLPTWRLMVREGTQPPRELARAQAGYAAWVGYGFVGANVVWAAAPGSVERGVARYDRALGTTTLLDADSADGFASGAEQVAWLRQTTTAGTFAVVAPHTGVQREYPIPGRSQIEGITASQVLLSAVQSGQRTLTLFDVANPPPQVTVPRRATAPPVCNEIDIIKCGTIGLADRGLADVVGPWQPRGVQFFHPRFGINGRTFWDGNYASVRADGTLDLWLDRAQVALHVNLLRVFIDLPNTQNGVTDTPTSFATVFDFAQRAAARAIRLGLVIHNSADWAMTPERAAWISGLIDYFAARDALPLLAYINADNEINNHCADTLDCFDHRPGFDADSYLNGALAWTAHVAAIVHSRAPILVTVGIASEVRDSDTTRAAFDYFRADSTGRSLATLVDLLAPHNYSGGAAGVIDDLRFNGYTGPVVLEEFGYSTDPMPRDSFWTEGDAACRLAPFAGGCRNTAAYFVETNIAALRSRSYSGAIAWMLTDMAERNRLDACTTQPFELWTGLLASEGVYCGGTRSRDVGAPKATAVRVCLHFGGELFSCDPSLQRRMSIFLPFASAGTVIQ